MTRAVFMQGRSPFKFMPAFKMKLSSSPPTPTMSSRRSNSTTQQGKSSATPGS